MNVSLNSATAVPDEAGSRLFLPAQRANVFRFHSGSDLLESKSTSLSLIRRTGALDAIRLDKGAKRLPHLQSSSTFASARARTGVPWSTQYFARNSLLSDAISTPAGHSVLHARHSRHRSRAS